ncbi:MAG TPA: cytochrome c [Polyangia bacterium]|nr:cytochrome c [Polyangia bacterium]
MTAARSLLVAAAVALCAGACQGVLPEPDFERMITQRNVRPYTGAPFFPDDRAMRPPPAGTIDRRQIVGQPALTDGVVAGRYVTASPIPVDRALLARGRDRFDVFCAACHGVRGDGSSEVARHMELRRPPSLLEDPVRAFPPGRVFQVISLGYGLMPSYAAELPVADRWAAVAYLGALQLSQSSPLAGLPADVRAAAERSLR